MIDKIDLPVGTRFKAAIDGEIVHAVVEEGTCCSRCVLKESKILCIATACAEVDRKDFIPVYFKKDENS